MTLPLDDKLIAQAEDDVARAEEELRQAIAEADADAADVAFTLHELRARAGDDSTLAVVGEALAKVRLPTLPLTAHEARVLEARADAVRARQWVVGAMHEDLERFRLELGDVVLAAERARDELQRRSERPRISPTRRFERIRAVTTDQVLAARPEPSPRRQRPRARLDAAIDLHSDSNFFVGATENISDGGVFVATDKILDEGAEVDLVFTLPGGFEVRGRGLVRWHRAAAPGVEPGVGVQFVDLSGAVEDAVENFIALRRPLASP